MADTQLPSTTAYERRTQIERLARTHAALVRVLRRYFTTTELGTMFDALPVGTGQPLTTLVDAVGTAWAEEEAQDKRDAAKETDHG